jgi:hypothetical protein
MEMVVLRVLSGKDYIKQLGSKKKGMIYPKENYIPTNYPEVGSRYCCQVRLDEGERIENHRMSEIVERIRQYDERQIRDFIRRIGCDDLHRALDLEEETHSDRYQERDRREMIDERRWLRKKLRESESIREREEIEAEIHRINDFLEEHKEPEIICRFSIPPAWYISYRTGRDDWGIHFLEPLMYKFTQSAFTQLIAREGRPMRYPSIRTIPQYFFEAALYSVFEHESFHFAFNIFIDKCEKLLDGMEVTEFKQPILYSIYNSLVYAETYSTSKGATEEALATAWEYEALLDSLYTSISTFELDLDASSKELRKWKRESYPGYKRFHTFSNARGVDISKFTSGCLNLLKDALKKCSKRNRSATSSIQELSSVLVSFLPTRQELLLIDIPIYVHR